jgi:hypothetical protein
MVSYEQVSARRIFLRKFSAHTVGLSGGDREEGSNECDDLELHNDLREVERFCEVVWLRILKFNCAIGLPFMRLGFDKNQAYGAHMFQINIIIPLSNVMEARL